LETVPSERWRDGANQFGDLREGPYSDVFGDTVEGRRNLSTFRERPTRKYAALPAI
jgi:hypothetical protein